MGEAGRSRRDLESLLEVSKAMAGVMDLDSLLEVILAKATEVMEAERSTLFLHDERTRTLSVRSSGTLSRGQVRIPVGTGIAGHVAQTGQPLNIADAYEDPRFNPEVDRETSFRTRAVLCVPMFTHGGTLSGVIQVLNKVGGGTFSAEDEALLGAFASHAAIAIDRARLVEAFVEKKRIEENLKLAASIQRGMLPKRFPTGLPCDLAAQLRPAKSVGGDLYDFFVEGERLFFLVGDVSGKGMAAALFMAVTKALLHASVKAEPSLSGALGRVNAELCRDNDEAMFVTVFVGALDLGTGAVTVADAGHNAPYLMRAGGEVQELEVEGGLALGVFDGQAYRERTLPLSAGDALFLYTDGVSEGLNEAGEQFGLGRLAEHLCGARGQDAAEVVKGTLAALDAFAGAAPQFDDIAAMCVRYLPRA